MRSSVCSVRRVQTHHFHGALESDFAISFFNNFVLQVCPKSGKKVFVRQKFHDAFVRQAFAQIVATDEPPETEQIIRKYLKVVAQKLVRFKVDFGLPHVWQEHSLLY